MKVCIINHDEVRQLLPMNECMDVMEKVFKMLCRGDALNPLRHGMWLPDKTGILGMMPAYLGNLKSFGLKAISVFPSNQETEYDSHQGAVMLFETSRGRLLSLLDAGEITAIRTAAVSGIATKLLARKDAANLAILGSGVQARKHLESMLLARRIKHIRVWSRTPDHAQEFARFASESVGLPVVSMATAYEAVEGSDIICTTTAATDPVLKGDWLMPGMHINAVGSSVAFARELDAVAMAKSLLFVDRRESALRESGDFLLAKEEGAIMDDHIQGEIGEILLGQISGRMSPKQITLFKSLGLGIEDVAAAHHIYHKAVEQGLGSWVEFGGRRRSRTRFSTL